MKLAGIKPWWFVVIAVTIFAGCHGGGGSSVPPLAPGNPGAPGIPRNPMSVAADPVPTITPATTCTKTRDSNNNDNGPNYVCFVQGGATSNQMTLGPVHPDTWNTCSAGTYSFIPISGGVQPPTALPSPTVSYDPAQSTAGNCTTKEDSTTITVTFPSPLPQGKWAAPWVVREEFQFYAGGQWYGDHKDIGQVWLHPGLRIIDNDNSGSEIQNSTWERVVGQRVNISADHPYDDETVSSCNWAVPNGITPYAVGSYGSLTGSTPPSTMPSPSPMPTTAATSLTYYWVQSFDATQQNVTCSVSNSSGNGEGGPALPATQISAILNPYVVAPTINTLSATFGTIHQGQWDPNFPSAEQVSIGTLMNQPSSLGLRSTYTVTMPSHYGGTWGPNQTVTATTIVSPQPSPPPTDTGGAVWLDEL